MLQKMLLSSVALIGLTGLASAADMAFKAPPPVYVSTWTGCYLGGHAGYGLANSTSQYSAIEQIEVGLSGEYNESFSNKGFVGGGQAGCQYQTGMFLWGLEGDWSSFSNSSSYNHAGSFTEEELIGPGYSASVNQSLSYSSLWSVRGRFGIIASDVFTFMGRLVSAARRQTTPPRLRLMRAVLSRHYLLASVLQAPAMSVSIRPVSWPAWAQNGRYGLILLSVPSICTMPSILVRQFPPREAQLSSEFRCPRPPS
jgi:hypothetical protein